MMYMPIWILYWFQFFLPINYAIKFLLINVVLLICEKVVFGIDINREINAVKSLCFSVGAEIIGIATFYVLEMKMNIQPDFYYENYRAFSLIPFVVVAIFDFFSNYLFVFRKVNIPIGQRMIIATLISVAIAPYLFIILQP